MVNTAVKPITAAVSPQVAFRFGHRTCFSSYQAPLKYPPSATNGVAIRPNGLPFCVDVLATLVGAVFGVDFFGVVSDAVIRVTTGWSFVFLVTDGFFFVAKVCSPN